MRKLKVTILKWWCVVFHKSHHKNYWTEKTKRFFQCGKCGVNHSRQLNYEDEKRRLQKIERNLPTNSA